MSGWRGALFKEWTLVTQHQRRQRPAADPGLPCRRAAGTGVTGSIRPMYTGAPLYDAPPGFFLNPAAYVAPPPGQWGNAGRDTITGPAQFILGRLDGAHLPHERAGEHRSALRRA